MDYFKRVKEVFFNFKTFMGIILLGVIIVAIISFSSSSSSLPENNPESITCEDEQVYLSRFNFNDISNVDYSRYPNQGFADLTFDNDNQSWLNSVQERSEYKYIHFDGVDYGLNEDGKSNYSLSFYKVSELDKHATYEIHIYAAKTLSNIERRLCSENCMWIPNDRILDAGDAFRIEYFADAPCIPYTLVELAEYNGVEENIYDRVLITQDEAGVSIFRVLREEDLLD